MARDKVWGLLGAAEVARRTGYDRGAVWRWGTGRRKPYRKRLPELAAALGVSEEEVERWCVAAQERRVAQVRAERAREEAELDGREE